MELRAIMKVGTRVSSCCKLDAEEHPVALVMPSTELCGRGWDHIHLQTGGGFPWAFGLTSPRPRVDVGFQLSWTGSITTTLSHPSKSHLVFEASILCSPDHLSVPLPPGSSGTSKPAWGSSPSSSSVHWVTLGELSISLNFSYLWEEKSFCRWYFEDKMRLYMYVKLFILPDM